MTLREILRIDLLTEVMESWSKATGMATIALDERGKYITGRIGFTDFCTKYTRGSKEGLKRCIECDKKNIDVYYCHAGLMDFSIDIKLDDGTYLGKIIGGQILSEKPDEKKFRLLAKEFGIDEDEYIEALRKIEIRSEESIRASAFLLGKTVNLLVNLEYHRILQQKHIDVLDEKIKCDSLTQLYNTMYCKNKSFELIKQKERFALFMLDLDDFKMINDNYGHLFGDLVLIEVSKTLKNNLTSNATVGRFGGDEFVVLLPLNENEGVITVEEISKKLCSCIGGISFKEEPLLKINASIGVSLFPDDGISSDDLYNKADEALYEIKGTGKNNFKIYNR